MHTKARTVLGSRTKDHEETKHSSYAYKGRPEFTIVFMPFCMGSKGQQAFNSECSPLCCPIKTSSILQKMNVTTKSIDTGFLFVVSWTEKLNSNCCSLAR